MMSWGFGRLKGMSRAAGMMAGVASRPPKKSRLDNTGGDSSVNHRRKQPAFVILQPLHFGSTTERDVLLGAERTLAVVTETTVVQDDTPEAVVLLRIVRHDDG